MTADQIILKFRTYVDDGTELSTEDEYDLLNKVYRDVFTSNIWEFAKKEYSVAINGVSVSLPTDFSHIADSYNNEISSKLVWVGDNYYKLVNFSERKNYQDRSGYCWIDVVNNLLVFSESVSGTLTFDYVFFPSALSTGLTPAFPSAFHDVLYHLMAVDDYMIQQFDKARSYAGENQKKAEYWLSKMKMWNANLVINQNE